MEHLSEAITEALQLLISGDPGFWQIVRTSFGVSLQAILYASPVGFLAAFALAHGRFPGRQLLITLAHSLLAVPTVMVGLLLYMVFTHHGMSDGFDALFTQTGMVIGQILLSFPILVAMGHAALCAADSRVWETTRSLGAPYWRGMLTVMYEVRFGLLVAAVAAFGRVLAEVGCSMLVGGNILHTTRSLTTTMALETSRGDFARGFALGVVLLLLAFLLNGLLTTVRVRMEWVK